MLIQDFQLVEKPIQRRSQNDSRYDGINVCACCVKSDRFTIRLRGFVWAAQSETDGKLGAHLLRHDAGDKRDGLWLSLPRFHPGTRRGCSVARRTSGGHCGPLRLPSSWVLARDLCGRVRDGSLLQRPGIGRAGLREDPHTSCACAQWVGAALRNRAGRCIGSLYHYGDLIGEKISPDPAWSMIGRELALQRSGLLLGDCLPPCC